MQRLFCDVQEATKRCLASGSLVPLRTTVEEVPSLPGRPPYRLLALDAAARKPPKSVRAPSGSPLLTMPEPDLVVERMGTHNLMLNKFPVALDHFLLCAAQPESQMRRLSAADCALLQAALASGGEEDGLLGFFNSGECSGASQSHKHVQVIPAAKSLGNPCFIESLARDALRSGTTGLEGLGFRHGFSPVRVNQEEDALLRAYFRAVEMAGVDLDRVEAGQESYNMLCTSRWVFVAPRSRETWVGPTGPVDINALGLAGSLLCKTREIVETVRKAGPLEVVRSVCYPV